MSIRYWCDTIIIPPTPTPIIARGHNPLTSPWCHPYTLVHSPVVTLPCYCLHPLYTCTVYYYQLQPLGFVLALATVYLCIPVLYLCYTCVYLCYTCVYLYIPVYTCVIPVLYLCYTCVIPVLYLCIPVLYLCIPVRVNNTGNVSRCNTGNTDTGVYRYLWCESVLSSGWEWLSGARVKSPHFTVHTWHWWSVSGQP